MLRLVAIFCFLLTMISVFAQPFMSDEERALLDDLMQREGIRPGSETFLKDWSSSTHYKLPVVLDVLANPFDYPALVQELDSLSTDPVSMHHRLQDILFQYPLKPSPTVVPSTITTPDALFDRVEALYNLAGERLLYAFADLDDQERMLLLHLLFSMWMEQEDTERYEDWFETQRIAPPEMHEEMEIEDYVPIIDRIDWHALCLAFNILHEGMRRIRADIDVEQIKTHLKSPRHRMTSWGNLICGSTGNDPGFAGAAFIFDPSGNDTYASLRACPQTPILCVIDLEGDDIWAGDGIAGTLSAAMGILVVFDESGNDLYRGDDFTLGAGLGMLHFEDLGGDDLYTGGLHSLGAGSFGIAMLLDNAGNDTYRVTACGEGFGGPLGAGLISDIHGHDLYYAGGAYFHKPLAPFDHRSLSQGFGFGLRPDMGGGVGMLFDHEGSDAYQCGVYGQGVAYWYALGMLADGNGNDSYNAIYYPQGSGIHLAAGFLYDAAGEDHYYSKNGPGQGGGHDYAVGFLIDRGGNDCYSVPGGNGLGLTNSVGVFIDVSGDDRYERQWEGNLGWANPQRDAGGLGFFLDTGGADTYAVNRSAAGDSIGDNRFWRQGLYGMGLDTLMVTPKAAVEELAEQSVEEIDSTAAISEIFGIASEWAVGSSKLRVERAREILLSREEEAAKYIFEHRMDSKSGLVFRAIDDFAEKSDVFKGYLPKGLTHEDSLVVKNTISLIASLEDSTYVPDLQKYVEQRKYLPSVVSGLGAIGTPDAVEILAGFIDDPSEKLRVITARGLKHIESERSLALLDRMRDDDSFLVRTIVKLTQEDEE